MHLRNVEIFCDVVARRSFSRAAELHHVSQSSASHAVSMLEKRLEMQLIDRSKRPLELTAAGQIYFEGCRDVLETLRSVEERIGQMRNRVVGKVHVAAIYSVGLLQLDWVVRSFRRNYPDVELRLNYLHPDEVYEQVLDDQADMGLVSFPREGGEISCTPWVDQVMEVVVHPEHRFAGRESIHAEELDGEEFVGFRQELQIRRQIDRWLRREKVQVQIVHQFDNVENIKRAVEIGSGIAILPIPTIRRELDAGSLVSVAVERVHWFRPLGIVQRRHKALSTAASKFVEILQQSVGEDVATIAGPRCALEPVPVGLDGTEPRAPADCPDE